MAEPQKKVLLKKGNKEVLFPENQIKGMLKIGWEVKPKNKEKGDKK